MIELLWNNAQILFVLMTVAWLYQWIRHNGVMFDISWAAGIAVVAINAFTWCDGLFLKRLLVLLATSIWAIRLIGYYIKRYVHGEGEGRFRNFKELFSVTNQFKFLLLFWMQVIAILIISWPLSLIASSQNDHISYLQICGGVLLIIGFIGESVADCQLYRFRSRIENRFKVCESGLWRFSRHPNYFFEWLLWMGVALIACESLFTATAFVSPLLLWYILFSSAGIKAAEVRSLLQKGDGYKRYQESTNRSIPWFSKAR